MAALTTHEAQVTVVGNFDLDENLLDVLGDALENTPRIIDPILSIDQRTGLLEISAEVESDTPAQVIEDFRAAVGRALESIGAIESWRPIAPREAVIA